MDGCLDLLEDSSLSSNLELKLLPRCCVCLALCDGKSLVTNCGHFHHDSCPLQFCRFCDVGGVDDPDTVLNLEQRIAEGKRVHSQNYLRAQALRKDINSKRGMSSAWHQTAINNLENELKLCKGAWTFNRVLLSPIDMLLPILNRPSSISSADVATAQMARDAAQQSISEYNQSAASDQAALKSIQADLSSIDHQRNCARETLEALHREEASLQQLELKARSWVCCYLLCQVTPPIHSHFPSACSVGIEGIVVSSENTPIVNPYRYKPDSAISSAVYQQGGWFNGSSNNTHETSP